MILRLYDNKSENNVIKKSVEELLEIDGTMREACDFLDPVFTLELDDDLTWEILEQANYCKVPKLDRYYYITSKKAINRDLYQITCHVDVLYSFKDEILANKGIIRRQQNKYNLYLDDGTFRIMQYPQLTTHLFPNGFSAQNFVLAVAGSSESASE